ncbi:YbbN family protein [Natronorarus salvus]|uniref:hypothetical protein n=1 Tax=Natronorarus salvus TaxID=3117733 RepID=UPI002F2693A1
MQEILPKLESWGVISGFFSEGEMKFSEEYIELFEQKKKHVEEINDPAKIFRSTPLEGVNLENFNDLDKEFTAHLLVINQISSDIADEMLVKLSILLHNSMTGLERLDGLDETFFPVHPRQLSLFTSIFDPLIVFVWTDNSKPCEKMAGRIQNVKNKMDIDIIVASVHGPTDPYFLKNDWGLKAAPTTLTIENSQVTCRMLGVRSEEAIERELALLEI